MNNWFKSAPQNKKLGAQKWLTAVTLLLIALQSLSAAGTAYAQESASRGRRVSTAPAAEATVSVNEQFLNSFLIGIFDNLSEPAMPLTAGGGSSDSGCASMIRLKREVGGVRTAVHLENGRIAGPLAFAGAYNSSILGCIAFSGWTTAEVNLAFDGARQALGARFKLREIHLNDVPEIASGPILKMVQSEIDRRYDPLELFTLEQLSPRVNIPPAGGALKLRAREIRPEITPTALTFHITYDFVRG